jgi:hypothetical protein
MTCCIWCHCRCVNIHLKISFCAYMHLGLLGYFNAVVQSIFGFRKQSSYWQRSEIYLHLVVPSPKVIFRTSDALSYVPATSLHSVMAYQLSI